MDGIRVETFGELRETVGSYMKDAEGIWWCHVPIPDSTIGRQASHAMGALSAHTITEHDDGTITVSPSILIPADDHGCREWHGFLERGVWREC